MKDFSLLKDKNRSRLLVLLLVLIVPPIPFIILGWEPAVGSPQGFSAALTILVSYAAYYAVLGALANATGFSLRDWLEPAPLLPSPSAPLPPTSLIPQPSSPPPPPSSFIPPPSQAAPHTLPAPPGDFTGRASEVEELTQQLAGGTRVAISGLAGMGGVGKTVLALYVANQLKPQYPDAQIMLEMKGTSSEPLSATDAMIQVIHTFDATADLRQATPEQIHALYLNLLSDKRALLLFDNARDAGQVKPLIPPTSCGMLVTSRRHFVLPGMDTLRLDMLPEADSRKLLLTICPRIGDHADEIAKLCGQLPLALRIAASALAEHRDLLVDEYTAGMADRRTRLAKLKSESDPELDLQATFEYSYELLADDTKARWRALAVFPASFDWNAAASVLAKERWRTLAISMSLDWNIATSELAIKAGETRKFLSDLVRFSLLDYDEVSERYSLHDLLVDFANKRLSDEEREIAQLRHAQHYVEISAVANKLYLNGDENALFGLKLFDEELQNIRAGQAWAARNMETSVDATRLCSEYPGWSGDCLNLRLHAKEWIHWLIFAVSAANRLGDKQVLDTHLGNLGHAYSNLGESRKAIDYYNQALAISREIADKRGEGNDLGNLGSAYYELGDARKAIEYIERALVIDREIGNHRGECADLGNLGNTYRDLGEPRKAIEFFEQALAIAREIGDRLKESNWLGGLGNAYLDFGDTSKAIHTYELALAIAREIGDQRNEGAWLGNLGSAYMNLGYIRQAIEHYEQALAIARKIGNRRAECSLLSNFGIAYRRIGEIQKAIKYHEQALEISREIGNRRGEGCDLGSLGNAYYDFGEKRKAIGYYKQALLIAREVGDWRGGGTDLSNLGNAYADLGETHKAIEFYEHALAIFRQLEDKVNEEKVVRALEELRKKEGG